MSAQRKYPMAPPLKHPERLHHSTRRSAIPRVIDWDALREYDRTQRGFMVRQRVETEEEKGNGNG